MSIQALSSIEQYQRLRHGLRELPDAERKAHCRNLCLTDLYFLIRDGLGREDIEKQWLFDRCREVQANPDGFLDLWAREHYKSTIITFGLTIQDILNDPEVTVGIFSFNRPIAKQFLRQIKVEFERNELLKEWFPDVLWQNPGKEAPKWSEDEGIVVKRKGNPKEATVEAWGLIDGQPTSKHFKRLVYDDVVTDSSVTTPDMIGKVTAAWELSDNLMAEGGKKRHVGTRYHANDTYRAIMAKGIKPRVYAATEDGTESGKPVLLSAERLAEKRTAQGPYIFSCQMLQQPKADASQRFERSWLKHYQDANGGDGMNKYMLVDPANEKKAESDYTAIWVIGLASDENYYALDIIRDKLNLTERAAEVMRLHRKWKPMEVRYEKYGMQADIAHLQSVQEKDNYRFDVIPVAGITSKRDRIKRLIPIFEQGKFYLPITKYRTDYEGIARDMVTTFVEEEFVAFPVALHEDMLDSLARIAEPELPLVWPLSQIDQDDPYEGSFKGYSAWAA